MVNGHFPLNTERRRNTSARGSEDREKGVTLRAFFSPTMVNELVANDLMMVRQDFGVRTITQTS
jgi:hypothetical protein